MTAITSKAIFSARRDGYVLSTDPGRIDIGMVHGFLSNDSYWAKGLDPDVFRRALDHSLVIGIYTPDGIMVAFGRVVTDYAMFAYLRDVFTLSAHRGKGLAS